MERSETLMEWLVGMPIQGIGAGPAWKWVADEKPKVSGGQPYKGRYYWGKQHEFWVQQVGVKNDKVLLGELLKARARTKPMQQYIESRLNPKELRFVCYLEAAFLTLVWGAFYALVFILFASWRKRPADEATRLSLAWQIILTIILLLPVALNIQFVLSSTFAANYAPDNGFGVISFSLLVLLPPLAAIRSRAPGARFRTAWRGNLRRILPVVMALCMLAFIPLTLIAFYEEARFAQPITSLDKGEMARLRAYLGDKWTHPPIPKDAWRAEYPPKQVSSK
jgi:hypothetical protein